MNYALNARHLGHRNKTSDRNSIMKAIHLFRCFVLCLAGCAIYIPLAPETVFGEEPASPSPAAPKLDHILLEVSNLKASIAFYRDFLGLRLKSESDWFVMLESDNVGVFLRNSRWDWEKRSGKGEQLGLGMYPHLEVSDAAATVEKARKAGYRVVQEPRTYDFGTEAFIADPDGYTWAIVSPPKVASSR
jgi:catechol 2,3-dioxygenase-like lactoylglutathione lyase family enzyme